MIKIRYLDFDLDLDQIVLIHRYQPSICLIFSSVKPSEIDKKMPQNILTMLK